MGFFYVVQAIKTGAREGLGTRLKYLHNSKRNITYGQLYEIIHMVTELL